MLEAAVAASLLVGLTALLGVVGLAREMALMRIAALPSSAPRMNLRLPSGNRDGLAVGTRAPAIRATALDGSAVQVPPAATSVVLFAMMTCSPCERLLRDLGRRGPDTLDGVPFVLVEHGGEADVRKIAAEFSLNQTIVIPQQGWEIARKFEIFSAPHAFAVSGGIVVAHDTVRDFDHLLEFAESARQGRTTVHEIHAAPEEVAT